MSANEYGYDINVTKIFDSTDGCEITFKLKDDITREVWESIIGGIPIVRCEDCEHCDVERPYYSALNSEIVRYKCQENRIYVPLNGFCYKGRQR